jgi:DNA-binding transcriptional MerR regulator
MSHAGYTVGQVAALSGVTVRTLHHYDHVGLVRPSGRTSGGYRQYDDADLTRLHQVLSYRELGLSLDTILSILSGPAGREGASDEPDAGTALGHLRRQHQLVLDRIDRLQRMLGHIEKAMEAEQMGISLTPEEQFEVFGPHWDPQEQAELAGEAEQRWGETDAWAESRRRTSSYTAEDWAAIKAEAAEVETALADAKRRDVPPDSAEAMDRAEAHRAHLSRWFYDVSPDLHRGLADMYVADPRFAAHYDQVEPGLAAYLREAVHANAERLERG